MRCERERGRPAGARMREDHQRLRRGEPMGCVIRGRRSSERLRNRGRSVPSLKQRECRSGDSNDGCQRQRGGRWYSNCRSCSCSNRVQPSQHAGRWTGHELIVDVTGAMTVSPSRLANRHNLRHPLRTRGAAMPEGDLPQYHQRSEGSLRQVVCRWNARVVQE
jgi:hypothetical protein